MRRTASIHTLASLALCLALFLPNHAAWSQTPTDANGNPIAPVPTATDANGNPIAVPMPVPTDANGNPIGQPPMATDANGNPIAPPPMATDANGNPIAQPPMATDANGTPIAPAADSNPAPAPAQPMPNGVANGGAVKKAPNGLCLEPGHPSYESVGEVTRYPTMRACIAQGGQRDVRTDPLTAGTTPTTPPGVAPTGTPPGMDTAVDPATGLPTAVAPTAVSPTGVDPATGLPTAVAPTAESPTTVDPVTGLALPGVDPATGLPMQAIDPVTGLPVDGALGQAAGALGAQPTAEEIARLREMGMPVDQGMLEAYGFTTDPTQEIRPRVAVGGPKGITLPKQPSYSETPGIFREPSAYIGRSAQDFAP